MIFADSSFWIALEGARDANHLEAKALAESLSDAQIATSNHVRGETWTYLRRKRGHAAAVRYLDSIEKSPRVTLLRIEDRLEERAIRWLRAHDERSYSFVDATSFALMNEKKIREALAFDGDFSAAGFVELRRQ